MSGNGFRLRTFGTPTLHRLGDFDQIGSPRRKSLAFLALLAAQNEGYSGTGFGRER